MLFPQSSASIWAFLMPPLSSSVTGDKASDEILIIVEKKKRRGEIRGRSCNASYWQPTVEVYILELFPWPSPMLVYVADGHGEGIRHETNTGNGREAINCVSIWWGIMGRGPVVWISVRPKVTLSWSLDVSCPTGHSIYRLGIARALNKYQTKDAKVENADQSLPTILRTTRS